MFAVASVACLAYAAYKWVNSSNDSNTSNSNPSIDFRELAAQEATARNKCYDEATKAYKNGNKKQASILSEEGKIHDKKMREYNAKASEVIFDKNNKKYNGDLGTIDLHGLHVKEALAKTEQHLLATKRAGLKQVLVITGRGNNSVDNIAKLKPSIMNFLKEQNMKATVNEGSIIVELNVSSSEAGWFDISNCLVM